jgi:hypothetical protein
MTVQSFCAHGLIFIGMFCTIRVFVEWVFCREPKLMQALGCAGEAVVGVAITLTGFYILNL